MAAEDITTLAKVRAYQQHDATVALDNDTLVSELITRASRAFMEATGRQFRTALTAGTAVQFLYRANPMRVLHLQGYDASAITSVTMDADTTSPTVLAATEYRKLPIPRKHGVINALYLPNHDGSAEGRVVEVVGTWGWPTVPGDVEQAVIDTVVHWLDRQTPGGQLGDENMDRFGPVMFPSSARQVMFRYRQAAL